ncbi:MAG: TlpA disulfide reductase family protein [Bacteroidota bacterium]
MRHLLYFLVLLLFDVNLIKAQEIINPSDVVIEGILTDSINKNDPEKPRVVRISISKYPFDFKFLGTGLQIDEYEIATINNKSFRFIIKSPADRFYAYIEFAPMNGLVQWNGYDNSYILEKGDRIKCRLSDTGYQFSGIGSEKLNCQSEIYSLQYRFSEDDFKLAQHNQYEEFITNIDPKMDSCLGLQRLVIENYNKIIGRDLADVMLANCYGLRYYQWISFFHYNNSENVIPYLAFLKSSAFRHIDLSILEKVSPQIIDQSYVYSSFLFLKTLFENNIYEDGKLEPFSSDKYLEKVFNSINRNYVGILRDKLLCMFMINFSTKSSVNKFLDPAIGIVETKMYTDFLQNLKSSRGIGVQFFNFNLTRIDGSKFTLSQLKNKVAIVDFWFNGCENCVSLNAAMHSVIEKYKNNSKVVFLSISIDKVKANWIKGIGSGKYTHPNAINLYTEGLGSNHPLIKNYNIVLYPTLFILKNQKFYSSNPPVPSMADMNNLDIGNTKKFVDMIEESLRNFK